MSPFKNFARFLRAASPILATELRRGLRSAGEAVAALARDKAGFSSRIPLSIKVQVRGVGVSVVAGGSKAPNAVAIENGGKGFVRHPTFVPLSQLPGPPGSWTSLNSHAAYLQPAAVEGQAIAVAEALEAIDKSVASIPEEL